MLLTSQGLPLKIVYISDFSKGGDVLVSKLDIKTIADLKGKKIGVNALDGFDHYFLLYLLKQNGLDVSDVKLIEIPAHEVLDALESGIIDAGQVWEPYQSQIIASGYRLLASSADAPVAITDVLIFHAKFVEERPEDVKKVVKALFRALEFRDNNEIESYKIMSEALAVSPSSLKVTIEGNVFPNLEENKAAFSRSDQPTSLYNTGEVITNFFIEKGVYDEPINVDKILATEIINEITMEG